MVGRPRNVILYAFGIFLTLFINTHELIENNTFVWKQSTMKITALEVVRFAVIYVLKNFETNIYFETMGKKRT